MSYNIIGHFAIDISQRDIKESLPVGGEILQVISSPDPDDSNYVYLVVKFSSENLTRGVERHFRVRQSFDKVPDENEWKHLTSVFRVKSGSWDSDSMEVLNIFERAIS